MSVSSPGASELAEPPPSPVQARRRTRSCYARSPHCRLTPRCRTTTCGDGEVEITMLLRPDRAHALVPPGDRHAVPAWKVIGRVLVPERTGSGTGLLIKLGLRAPAASRRAASRSPSGGRTGRRYVQAASR